jgi:hypothetical protein
VYRPASVSARSRARREPSVAVSGRRRNPPPTIFLAAPLGEYISAAPMSSPRRAGGGDLGCSGTSCIWKTNSETSFSLDRLKGSEKVKKG